MNTLMTCILHVLMNVYDAKYGYTTNVVPVSYMHSHDSPSLDNNIHSTQFHSAEVI